MAEICKQCGTDGSGCDFINYVNTQPSTGMHATPDLKGQPGPYWPRARWDKFVANCEGRSKAWGCIRSDEVAQKLSQIQKEKVARGEIIDK